MCVRIWGGGGRGEEGPTLFQANALTFKVNQSTLQATQSEAEKHVKTRRDRNMALQAEQRHNVNSAGHTVTDGQKKTNKQTNKKARGSSLLFWPVAVPMNDAPKYKRCTFFSISQA